MLTQSPRLVAWEITRRCNLYCAHCRASSTNEDYPGELTTKECFHLIDNIVLVGKPILILTGGEPLYRNDFFDIAEYASEKGLRVAVGSNGTLIDKAISVKLKEIPLSRLAISIDFPIPTLQDEFRGTSGSFNAAIAGIENAIEAGLEVQINSTITKLNARYLEDLLTLALDVKAVAFHPFMLVPTGRGKALASQELPPEEYERILNWIFEKQVELGNKMFIKPTDAPHYMRILKQRFAELPLNKESAKTTGMNSLTRGCLAGTGFCFISHVGRVQGCGYLDVEAGNIRKSSFCEIWRESPLFNELRDLSKIKGKCGICEFRVACGGCRARAFETSGDYLAEEPYCIHQPMSMSIKDS